GVSPAFFIAAALYAAAAVTYGAVFASSRQSVARAARWLLFAGFLAHAVEIGWRGVESVHPGTSVREALGFLSWLMVGGYLLAGLKYPLQLLGAFVTPTGLIVLAVARLSPSGEALPGLGTLGRIHIALATLGVAIFALATALAIVYLLEERNLKRKQFDGILFRRGVALDSLDRLAHRLILIGFPIFTLSIMLGVIWVSQRGSGFDRPEYPLALITWLSFAGLIVARTTHGWRGRRTALLTVIGFVAALLVFSVYFVRRALM
ncbi:MAG: cytochrome c biogenesis protein CcsA, partial [Myxococcota bacterium]